MALNSVCVHGHFYQPPREDPVSGFIPDEGGAEPYRNWNERIHAECYRPNAELGNFGRMSFNFGPTVLNWMSQYDPGTYALIIAQERENFERYGVGNGMAQTYHHTILPLSSARDRITQIVWGIADFKHHFGHQPLGMWLPETAVNLETLVALSDQQIAFTVLAPWQVKESNSLDGQGAYLVELPAGRQPMIVFLYNQWLSTSISFWDDATRNADNFVDQWVIPSFEKQNNSRDQCQMLASDGELYGHHKVFRDKFLSHLLNGALAKRGLRPTFPGLWLQEHTPRQYVSLVDNTSWSCHHGVDRWRKVCPCTTGALWKEPFYNGTVRLAEAIDYEYEQFLSLYCEDIWDLRNDWIKVKLGAADLRMLLAEHLSCQLHEDLISKIQALLSAQFERQRMFTSCGWFFDHFHRIEPQNNIAYAAQAVWLTRFATGADLVPLALQSLQKVKDEQTGLRGDTVFLEKYQRIEHYAEDNPSPESLLNSVSI